MSTIEPLEARSLLSAAAVAGPASGPDLHLTAPEVQTILARAASQAVPTQAVVVVDREGVTLGVFALHGAGEAVIFAAAARAKTAAFFQSRENAFTTRTARFIIQDHFPQPVRRTPGGPLYGVQFSSLPTSDVLPFTPQTLSISGDPGGVPLYKDGSPVGGIGVAGDMNDVRARSDLAGAPFEIPDANPENKLFPGREERDADESVALAGARGFMAPARIRATRVFVDGLRFPFAKSKPARGQPDRTLDALIASGAGQLREAPALGKTGAQVIDSPPSPYPAATFSGVAGELKNTAAPGFGIVDSDDVAADGVSPLPESERLVASDVVQVISNAVTSAIRTRAGIRRPLGTPAKVHVSVVDRDGDLLGVFRMMDGTNFSFDVSVQKARTAAFFSDDAHAFSTRAVGFASQRFFPPGIESVATGPLFGLQKQLSLQLGNASVRARNTSLRNGITIFPGGVPLYKNGRLVGAVGISGDGVDQDDRIAFAGARGMQPSEAIRSDTLSSGEVTRHLVERVSVLDAIFDFEGDAATVATERLAAGLSDFRLPYVKFPRNPER